jgi:hypothetical protein
MRVHESERQERQLKKSQVEELHVIEPCDEGGGGKIAKSNQKIFSFFLCEEMTQKNLTFNSRPLFDPHRMSLVLSSRNTEVPCNYRSA